MQKLISSSVAKESQRILNLAKPLVAGGKSTLEIANDLLRSVALQDTLELCGLQTVYTLRSLKAAWAARMLDAFGKPENGLLEGNLYWPGEFDECRAVTSNGNGNLSFTGQYCKVSVPVSLDGQKANLQIGVCVPSGCRGDDVTTLSKTVLTLIQHNNSMLTTECHEIDRPLSPRAVLTVVLCAMFALCLIIGTAYEAATRVLTDEHAITKSVRSLLLNDSAAPSNRVDSEGIEQTERSALLTPSDKRHLASEAGIASRLLLSFSVYSNGRKLFSTSQPESSNLGCVNGVRFLSMCWVILGHTYVYSIADANNPASFQAQTLRRPSFQVMVNGTVCVDSFFLISALLVTYLLLKDVDRKKGKLRVQEWILVYVHRYIRLTAPYALLLMIWTCLAVYFYDGPSWPTSESLDPVCDNYWWTNLLYINNFVPGATGADLSCMGWTWYLACDMQFFVVTPLIVWLLYRVKYAGIGVTIAMVAASIVSSAVVSVRDNFQVGPFSANTASEKGIWFADYYTKPWIRFSPYGIGILLGYVLHQKRENLSLRPLYNMAGWTIAAIFCLSVLYGPFEVEAGSRSGQASAFEAAAYNSLSRTVWAIGLAWVIFACSTHNGGWVNTLLSWKPFSPLARLTYCAYLLHPMILIMAEYSARATFPYDDVTMILRFLGVLLCGMSLAVIASLSFEAPLMNLEKILLQSRHQRQK